MRARWMASAVALTAALAAPVAAADAPANPLDALTGAEIDRTVAILTAARQVDANTRYPTITLLENPKAEVLRWVPGQPFARRARADYLRGNRLFEAAVNLTTGKVDSVEEVKDRQSAILFEEFLGASEVVKKDPRWRAAMARRGITNFDNIICAPLTVGPVIDERYRGLRLLKVPCFDKTGAVNNVYGRPIENLLSVVDVRKGAVIDVIDLGVVPIPHDIPSHAYDAATSTRQPARPVQIVAPQGPNFTLDGSSVSWDKWNFHLRVDKRLGPVISRITYRDGNDTRQVAYQMNTSEMFVPYMDPSQTWAYRAYMDIGEYGFGALASPLKPGSDCPVDAKFLDATISDDHGKPLIFKNVVCIFERDTGEPLWRHYEFFTKSHESRPNVELVVRMAPEVGNYDYLLDFAFNRRGEVEIRVGAYGIDAVKAVAARKMDDATAAEDTKYGTLIAPNLVGVNHDHFMSFRVRSRRRRPGQPAGPRQVRQAHPHRQSAAPKPVAGRALGGSGRRRARFDARPCLVPCRKRQAPERDGQSDQLPAGAGPFRSFHSRSGRTGAAASGFLRRGVVGHQIQSGRDVRRGRLSQPEPQRRRPAAIRRKP